MERKQFEEMSSQELLVEIKKLKGRKIVDAVIIGFSFGVMIFSAVKNGFSFFTFFPLLVVYLIVKNLKNDKILQNEIDKELEAMHE
jgi:hypothetical protein